MSILETIGTEIKLLGHKIDIEFITGFFSDDSLQAIADVETNKIYVKTRSTNGDLPESVQVSHIIHEVLETINSKTDGWFFGAEGSEKESKISTLSEIIVQLLYDNFDIE